MFKTRGVKAPDKYELTMGLTLRAWSAGGIIKHLKEMPRDTVLVSIKYREEFSEVTLQFEENIKD